MGKSAAKSSHDMRKDRDRNFRKNLANRLVHLGGHWRFPPMKFSHAEKSPGQYAKTEE